MANNYTNFESGHVAADGIGEAFFARKRGKSHVRKGKVCQDYCIAQSLSCNAQYIAVADGHGRDSYLYSDIGSKIACTILGEVIENAYKNHVSTDMNYEYFASSDFKKGYIQAWKKAVIRDYDAREADSDLSDSKKVKLYGTTILFVIVFTDAVVLGQLGDGAILMFDDKGNSQLFKRHFCKYDSKTNSVASGDAAYGFFVEVFDKNAYHYFLLSTDGIYDRLTEGESFIAYGENLVRKIKETKSLPMPFVLDDTDVSEIAIDDCTIALAINHNYSDEKSTISDKLGFDSIIFSRRNRNIDIYRAKRGETSYIVHIWKKNVDFEVIEVNNDFILNPNDKINISDEMVAYSYEIPLDYISIQELMECETHLESYSSLTSEDEYADFNCEFWVKVYKRILEVKDILSTNNLTVNNRWMENTYADKTGKLVLTKDALVCIGATQDFDYWNKFFDAFNYLGVLSCEGREIPLYKASSKKLIIPRLEEGINSELGRVVCAKKSDDIIYGLCNMSGHSWRLIDDVSMIVDNNGIIRLSDKCSFEIVTEPEEIAVDISQKSEVNTEEMKGAINDKSENDNDSMKDVNIKIVSKNIHKEDIDIDESVVEKNDDLEEDKSLSENEDEGLEQKNEQDNTDSNVELKEKQKITNDNRHKKVYTVTLF